MNKLFCYKIDRFLKQYYKSKKNSGCVRITLKDEIIYENFIGYADIEKQKSFTNKSVFSFYSLTKPFVAIGLMKLKDKNLVDIDCHPSKYVPEAKGFDSRVTIRQILNHIGGLPDFVQTARFDEKYDLGLPEHIRSHLKELAGYPMAFRPGTRGMYANVNYVICALIIENVSGMNYADYMINEVFNPLGMTNAQIDNKDLIIGNRVTGYELQDGNPVPVDRELNWMFGAGDIVGTIDDVYCLNRAIKHRLLLKPETWEEILTPSPVNSMGMGCTIDSLYGKNRITHNGGSRGFRTLHVQVPEDDLDIIFMSNSGWGEARRDLRDAVFRAYYGIEDIVDDQVKMDAGYI